LARATATTRRAICDIGSAVTMLEPGFCRPQVAAGSRRTTPKVEKQHRGVASALAVDERRQHQRVVPEGATVRLETPDRSLVALFNVDNLSEGGALIAGRIDVEPGTTVNIEICLAGVPPFAVPARILRHVGRGESHSTALMFLRESPELSQWIGDLVLQGLRAAFPEI
jgi:hypothetical protein